VIKVPRFLNPPELISTSIQTEHWVPSRKKVLWPRCQGSCVNLNSSQQVHKKDRNLQKLAFGDFRFFLCVCVDCGVCGVCGFWCLRTYGPMCPHLAFAGMTQKQQKHVALWAYGPMSSHPTFNGLTKKQQKQKDHVVIKVPRFLNSPELISTSMQKKHWVPSRKKVLWPRRHSSWVNLSSPQQVHQKRQTYTKTCIWGFHDFSLCVLCVMCVANGAQGTMSIWAHVLSLSIC